MLHINIAKRIDPMTFVSHSPPEFRMCLVACGCPGQTVGPSTAVGGKMVFHRGEEGWTSTCSRFLKKYSWNIEYNVTNIQRYPPEHLGFDPNLHCWTWSELTGHKNTNLQWNSIHLDEANIEKRKCHLRIETAGLRLCANASQVWVLANVSRLWVDSLTCLHLHLCPTCLILIWTEDVRSVDVRCS